MSAPVSFASFTSPLRVGAIGLTTSLVSPPAWKCGRRLPPVKSGASSLRSSAPDWTVGRASAGQAEGGEAGKGEELGPRFPNDHLGAS